jgi:glycosyltransferase involved in cell wall biosynthesis
VRAFATSQRLAPHRLEIIGDGPEMGRLRAIVAEAGAEDRVSFAGRKSQAEVAQAMRTADAFVFPSIRELGAGVVIEAMTSGAVLVVTDYGAPSDLAAGGRGLRLPLGPPDALVAACRGAMERCLDAPDEMSAMAARGREYAFAGFTWDAKADFTTALYERLVAGEGLAGLDAYA